MGVQLDKSKDMGLILLVKNALKYGENGISLFLSFLFQLNLKNKVVMKDKKRKSGK